jgi:mRNA interferase MazF
MKTAISVPDDTFQRVEQAAKRLGVSRSEFYARAAQSWLDALDDEATTDAIREGIHRCRRCRPCLDRSRLMRRGEVWWADLGLPRGSAPALRRPVLIISSDPYNRSSLKTVTVAVLTGNARLAALPGNVAISTEFAELETDSVVNMTQLATIDRETLEQRVTTLPDWLMARRLSESP